MSSNNKMMMIHITLVRRDSPREAGKVTPVNNRMIGPCHDIGRPSEPTI